MILLRDLSVVMVAAAATTLCCHILKQPVVIGYLLAGLIIGPHTPPFSLISDVHSIETLAELGLVFLMFAIGLEFNLPKLRRVGLSAGLAALLEVIGMMGIGYGLGKWFGWSSIDGLFLGAILAISSTTIIAKVFTDLKLLKEEFAQVVFGILILEDVIAIVILAILSGLGASRVEGSAAIRALMQVTFFVILFLVLGLALVPRFLRWVGRFRSRELLGIIVLGLCLASALLASYYGFSVALGAFLMGSIIGVSSEIDVIEEWIHPIRDMFSAIFFVSAGLLIQPQMLWDHRVAVFVIALVTVLGKVMSGAAGSFLAGYNLKTSFKVGMSLAQIGEFSFVFAALALKSKMASDFLYPLAVAVSAITTLSTPYLIRSSDGVVERLLRMMGKPLAGRLDGYHRWISERKANKPENLGIISRYVIRLTIYGSLFFAALSIFSFAARLWTGDWIYEAVGWTVGYLACLPLIRAIATYATHFILVCVTESLVRLHALNLLQHLSVYRFYSAFHSGLMAVLSLIFLWKVSPIMPSDRSLWVLVAIAVILGLALRSWVLAVYERLEKMLDEALGLATSEPLRQAALKTEEKSGVLSESMERFSLSTQDSAVHKSLRSLGLREKSGASLIAIYRRGKLITNPPPEMILAANDTLVLMGEKAQRRKARQVLQDG